MSEKGKEELIIDKTEDFTISATKGIVSKDNNIKFTTEYTDKFVDSFITDDKSKELSSRKLVSTPYGNANIFVFKNKHNKEGKIAENNWIVLDIPMLPVYDEKGITHSEYTYRVIDCGNGRLQAWFYIENMNDDEFSYKLAAFIINQYLFNGAAKTNCVYPDDIAYAPDCINIETGSTCRVVSENKVGLNLNWTSIKELAAKWKKERLEMYPNLILWF